MENVNILSGDNNLKNEESVDNVLSYDNSSESIENIPIVLNTSSIEERLLSVDTFLNTCAYVHFSFSFCILLILFSMFLVMSLHFITERKKV